MAVCPISIPSHSIKTHLYHKRSNHRHNSQTSITLESYCSPCHPLDFSELEVSDDDEDDDLESEDSDFAFPNSFNSYASSSLSSSVSSTSPSFSFQHSFPTKKPSSSQLSAVTVSSSPVKKQLFSTSSSNNLAKLLEKQQQPSTVFKPMTMSRSNSVTSMSSTMSSSFSALAMSPKTLFQRYFATSNVDEVLPKSSSTVDSSTSSNSSIPCTQELQTWSVETHANNLVHDLREKPTRNRDYRVNPRFLIMYTYDYNSRVNGYLPNSHTKEEVEDLTHVEGIKDFHLQHNLCKISSISRDKLWENVVLPARIDPLPSNSIEYKDYVHVEESSYPPHPSLNRKHSIVKVDGCEYFPWSSLQNKHKSVKPAGFLKGGKTLVNGIQPSSGITKSQFTIKGWCNKRWVSTSLEEME
ncbi:hypothetical protein CAAN1_03S05006 [[Candida] anglica]|uniref:Uncharacterized protein n=1 Tax=[Candida] anglica TaxID=148631 RepID=A0ABP0EH29_9ASCO